MEDQILTILYWGFGLSFAIMAIIYNSINSKVDKLDDKINDIDRRLSRIEGALSVRDRCALNHDTKKEVV